MAKRSRVGSSSRKHRKSTSKVNYREGDWFAVPLRASGYAVGVIARASSDGTLLGYFFGPWRPRIPDLNELRHLGSAQAICVNRFGDLGLLNGEWPILGRLAEWDRTKWPTPLFVRYSPITDKPRVLVEYSDDDPSVELAERSIAGTVERLPEDGLAGHGAMEIRLSKLLAGSGGDSES